VGSNPNGNAISFYVMFIDEVEALGVLSSRASAIDFSLVSLWEYLDTDSLLTQFGNHETKFGLDQYESGNSHYASRWKSIEHS